MTDVKSEYVYPGVVRDTWGDEVVIRWDIEGHPLEQTYTVDQFSNRVLPRVGTQFLLHAAIKEAGEKTPLIQETIKEISGE